MTSTDPTGTYHAEETTVIRGDDVFVCDCNDDLPGMAEDIAEALNEKFGDAPGTLGNRETAIILAALRYWQRCGNFAGDDINDIATNNGAHDEMPNDEIDALCERLNLGETATRTTKFLQTVAAFTTDGEVTETSPDGWDMPGDDAVDVVTYCVNEARAILGISEQGGILPFISHPQ